jgi:2-phosphosulfolactate phosphatase
VDPASSFHQTFERAMICRYAEEEEGARSAADAGMAVVVVDAFRASATIAVLVGLGARVMPVASVEEAVAAPADFRIGERGGAKVPGFDFGNSPTEILASGAWPGSTAVLTTTNGTRVIEAASGAPAILTGSFINAGAVTAELANLSVAEVAVIGCGWRGNPASEDEAASGAILHRLAGTGAELDEPALRAVESYRSRSREELRDNSAARRLKSLGYEMDLDLCLQEDVVSAAPLLVAGFFTRAER